MTSPLDEDGFHSIAWDDAPAASQSKSPNALSAIDGDDESEGFETISPQSPVPEDKTLSASSSTNQGGASRRDDVGSVGSLSKGKGKGMDMTSRGSLEGARGGAEVHEEDWGGRWMVIQVIDPVKEHEGSKEQYVSYAVKTTVSAAARPAPRLRFGYSGD